FSKLSRLEIAPAEHPPAIGIIRVFLKLFFKSRDYFADAGGLFARVRSKRRSCAVIAAGCAAIDLHSDSSNGQYGGKYQGDPADIGWLLGGFVVSGSFEFAHGYS